MIQAMQEIKKTARLTFVSGGARSGKSRYARELALQLSPRPVFVATARVWDADFKERIDRHRKERDARWVSFEEEKQLSRLPLDGKVAAIVWVHSLVDKFVFV